MINKEIFSEEMTLLAKYYGKQLDQYALKRLHEILSAELTNEEFVRACQQVFRTEKFFPAPIDFIACVKGSILQRALIEWQSEHALRSVVGKKAWGSLPPDEGITSEIKFRRKQFLEAYEAFAQTASPSELAPTPPLPRIEEAKPMPLEREFEVSKESGEEARARIRRILAEKRLGDFYERIYSA